MSLGIGKKILIADDALFMRHLIKRALVPLQFSQICEAANGQELLDLYEAEMPDLVLSDIIMEKMDGVSAVRKLLGRHRDARIIIVSAINVTDVIQECIDFGVLDFVVKPFKPQTLVNAVIMALASKTHIPSHPGTKVR